jgi:hypothetical protein
MEHVESDHESSESEQITNTSESTNTSSVTVQNPTVKYTATEAIMFIYANVHEAQGSKGALTMKDCVDYNKAKNDLLKFFEPDNKSYTTKEINDAYIFFLAGCNKLQSTGAFHMDGSCMLYERFQFIEGELKARTSPAEKMRELQQKKTAQRQKNNGGNGGNSNNAINENKSDAKGRGRGNPKKGARGE